MATSAPVRTPLRAGTPVGASLTEGESARYTFTNPAPAFGMDAAAVSFVFTPAGDGDPDMFVVAGKELTRQAYDWAGVAQGGDVVTIWPYTPGYARNALTTCYDVRRRRVRDRR